MIAGDPSIDQQKLNRVRLWNQTRGTFSTRSEKRRRGAPKQTNLVQFEKFSVQFIASRNNAYRPRNSVRFQTLSVL